MAVLRGVRMIQVRSLSETDRTYGLIDQGDVFDPLEFRGAGWDASTADAGSPSHAGGPFGEDLSEPAA
jgi:hypothetical protein